MTCIFRNLMVSPGSQHEFTLIFIIFHLLCPFGPWALILGPRQLLGRQVVPVRGPKVLGSFGEVKLRFQLVPRNPFARNEVRSPKTEVKLRFQVVRRNPVARNEVRSSKTEVKLRFQVVPRNPVARPFRTK